MSKRTIVKEDLTADQKSQIEIEEEPRIILHNISWSQYDTLVQAFTDKNRSLRMTYLKGTLQLMTISREHERIKTIIARLVETYSLEKDIDLNGYGSSTFRKELAERGLEPDECYSIGEIKDVPDIAIEVVITSGGIDKLEVYRGLEVKEVWFWIEKEKRFVLYRLNQDSAYEQIIRSYFLPELDFELLAGYVDWTNQTQAVKAFRDEIRG